MFIYCLHGLQYNALSTPKCVHKNEYSTCIFVCHSHQIIIFTVCACVTPTFIHMYATNVLMCPVNERTAQQFCANCLSICEHLKYLKMRRRVHSIRNSLFDMRIAYTCIIIIINQSTIIMATRKFKKNVLFLILLLKYVSVLFISVFIFFLFIFYIQLQATLAHQMENINYNCRVDGPVFLVYISLIIIVINKSAIMIKLYHKITYT